MSVLKIKRAYDAPDPSDGYRILVDRLWPRGVPRDWLQLDFWAKDVAPSAESRKAFGHDPERMEAFRARYCHELSHNPAASAFMERVRERLRDADVTLLYGARSETVNHAVILRDWLLEALEAQA